MVKKEGPKSLYLGLMPALARSVLYGGLRLGLYEPSKYVCKWAFGSTNLLLKIASGAFSGAVATALTNPMEVIKVYCHVRLFLFVILTVLEIIFLFSGALADEIKLEKRSYWGNEQDFIRRGNKSSLEGSWPSYGQGWCFDCFTASNI